MFVITGATGNVGGTTAHTLLKEGHAVKVIGRNAEKLSSFDGTSAQIAEGDVADSNFLSSAFEGATAVLLVLPGDGRAEDVRTSRRAITSSYLTALRNAGVQHVVAISSVGAHLPEGTGPVTSLYDLEQALSELTDRHILNLRPSFFLQNLYSWLGMVDSMKIVGMGIAPDIAIPMIHTKDIGIYAAKRLSANDYTGHTVQYLLGSRDYTLQEAATILGTAIGKPELPYIQFPADQFFSALQANGFSANMAQAYLDMSASMNNGSFHTDVKRSPDNTTATSLEDFAQEFSAMYHRSAQA
jgi:uncharacterized protein YbjT (DUF2867 family)